MRALRSGNHIYMSGHGPLGAGNVPMVVGKLGGALAIPEGREAARLACGRAGAPVAVPITWEELKVLKSWGRASQALPDR